MACREWGYPEPEEGFYERVNERLPEGVRGSIGARYDYKVIYHENGTFRFERDMIPYI